MIGVLALLVDMQLIRRALAALAFDPRPLSGEGLLTQSAFKAPCRKMHESHLAPNIQVANASLGAVMYRATHLATRRADRHFVFGLAKDKCSTSRSPARDSRAYSVTTRPGNPNKALKVPSDHAFDHQAHLSFHDSRRIANDSGRCTQQQGRFYLLSFECIEDNTLLIKFIHFLH